MRPAHPAKEWRLATFKCTMYHLEEQSQAGLDTVIWDDLPIIWGPVYNWCRLGLKESQRKAMEAPHLTAGETPDASRE